MSARATIAGIAVVTLMGAGCSSGASSGQATPTPNADVTVEMTEYTLIPTPASATAGPLTFAAKNAGTAVHELVVIKSALAPDKLPVKQGVAVEQGAGLEVIGEIPEFAPNSSRSKDFTLAAGDYVLICNVSGHYQIGMHAPFKVT